MGKHKKLVCLCTDVTEEDIEAAIDAGFKDIESLKRYTGIGTGVCQGKTCIPHVVRILSRKTGKSTEEVGIPTPRPPAVPVLMGTLAEGERKNER